MELIARGAEARLFKESDSVLRKFREEKPYRLPSIDTKIRSFRTRREFKVLEKLFDAGVSVPRGIELFDKEFAFTLELIKGEALKKVLNEELLSLAFNEVIKMHDCDIVHGDLTTLNMMLNENRVVLIDFGLALFSHKYEDKAVDLNLFFTCIKNEHPDFFYLKERLIEEYEKNAKDGSKIIERLFVLEGRGRNKSKN